MARNAGLLGAAGDHPDGVWLTDFEAAMIEDTSKLTGLRESESLRSIAISLKRIADVLDASSEQSKPTPHHPSGRVSQ